MNVKNNIILEQKYAFYRKKIKKYNQGINVLASLSVGEEMDLAPESDGVRPSRGLIWLFLINF